MSEDGAPDGAAVVDLGRSGNMRRRDFAAACAAGAALLLRTVDAAAQSARAVPAAESFVGDLATRGIGSLTVAGIGQDERARRFRALLVENFDVPTIARF